MFLQFQYLCQLDMGNVFFMFCIFSQAGKIVSYVFLLSAGLNVFHFSKSVDFFEAQKEKMSGKFRMLLKNLSYIL